jgi:hypothetical protein
MNFDDWMVIGLLPLFGLARVLWLIRREKQRRDRIR